MLDTFIGEISSQLTQKGYIFESYTQIPGAQTLCYCRSSQRIRLGFAKVEDHFLFIDGDYRGLISPASIKEIYKPFSQFVNRRFPVPHGLRMTIPNLAIVAISQSEFPAEVITFAQNSDLNPWYGGEIGQVILVNIRRKEVISLVSLQSGRYPRSGALPLGHSATLIRQVCGPAFDHVIE